MRPATALALGIFASAAVAVALAPLLLLVAVASTVALAACTTVRVAALLWQEVRSRPSAQPPSSPAIRMPAWTP